MSMYADQTSLCYQSQDLTLLNETINSDLKKLDTWLQGNKLSRNVAKAHSMFISTKQKQNSLKSQNKDMGPKIRDNDLEVVKKTKYLSVKIDCSLNWKEQIKAVSSQGSWRFKTCQVFFPERNFADSLHRHCGAPLSILLLRLGLHCFN